MPSPFSQALINLAPQMKPYRKTLGYSADPALEAYGLNSQFRDEALERRNKEIGLGDPNGIAKYTDLADLFGSRMQGPITDQAEDYEQFNEAQEAANLEGFSSPQDEARYGRQMAEEKMRLPLRQTEATGDTQREVTRQQGRNTIANTEADYAGRSRINRELAELGSVLGVEGQPVTGVTSGKTSSSLRFAQPPRPANPNPLNQTMINEAGRADRGDPGAEAALQSARAQFVQREVQEKRASQVAADSVWEVLNDPELADLPDSELEFFDISEVDQMQARNLLRQIRGK